LCLFNLVNYLLDKPINNCHSRRILCLFNLVYYLLDYPINNCQGISCSLIPHSVCLSVIHNFICLCEPLYMYDKAIGPCSGENNFSCFDILIIQYIYTALQVYNISTTLCSNCIISSFYIKWINTLHN